MKEQLRVGIVGATGAVGRELLRLLEVREFGLASLRLFGSERSRGQVLPFRGDELPVEVADSKSLYDLDLVFLSAGASRSREFVPQLIEQGAVCIDNSSAFRMDERYPLVVPEINGSLLDSRPKLVANPNCTAAILLMAIFPLLQLGEVERITLSTYQSTSGAGAAAMQELLSQSRAFLEGKPLEPVEFPHPIAFNLFSHNSPVRESLQNEEEEKVVEEVQKILGQPALRLSVTCVRVPVLRAHTLSIGVEYKYIRPNLSTARSALQFGEGIEWVDDPETNTFPMPISASEQNRVQVGRLRNDPGHERGLLLMACGDQLLKGAALNAVQIAERMF